MSSSESSVTVSAPAKVILFGEHAVVYGQPALAVPVSSIRVTVNVTPAAAPTIAAAEWTRDFSSDIHADQLTDPVLLMVQLTASHLGIDVPSARYEIASQIPVASGLGSGAAVSAAVGRAIAAAAGTTIPDDDLNALVYEIERIHHGTPSGIDNTVIVFEKPVYFVLGKRIEVFSVGAPLHLLIADTGRSALTKESVGDVRKLVDGRPEFALPRIERIGQIANLARDAISAGNLAEIGQLMAENHALLRDLTVSSPELDRLVGAALNAGAVGAKLSGGGRGGNMIALVTPETEKAVQDALIAADAVRVIATIVQPSVI
jgi:mevalonate kinase